MTKMIRAKAADGSIHKFPAGTSRDVINKVMKNYAVNGPPPMSLGKMAGEAASNLLPSAGHFIEGMAQPFMHPMDTARALGSVAKGEMGKLLPGDLAETAAHLDPESNAYADEMNKYFTSRYGSIEGFKKAVAADPVGVMSDVSILFTGGETGLTKLGLAGKASKVAGKIGAVTNPARTVGKVVKAVTTGVGRGAANIIGHIGTRTGHEVLRQAYEAGRAGGAASRTFLENMRRQVPTARVVEDAKEALRNMRAERGILYRAGKTVWGANAQILHFRDIDQSLRNTMNVKNFKGIDIQPSTAAVRKEISEAVEHWRKQNPQDFHTAEGFDALKQQIGDIRQAQLPNSPARLVANDAYHAVRNTIAKQEPAYAEAMQEYESASDEIEDIERSLSLGEKAAVDTSLRKLHSIMRNNVNANFGRRAELGEKLEQHGAPNLKDAIAGQTLNTWMPRGLGFIPAAGAVGGAAAGKPGLLALAPFAMPRLMGEAAHGLGAVARGGSKIPSGGSKAALAASQIGRAALDPIKLDGPQAQ